MDNTLSGLRKFVAPEYVFGADCRKLAGRYARNFGGSKVLLATDPGVMTAGWAADVVASLEAEHLSVTSFCGISPNPRDHEIMVGTDVYLQSGCDVIVAVGGGSVMDCAKGIGIVASNGGSILEYEGVDKVPVPMPPLICIPTTGGTSADVSQFAIINDTTEKVKIAIISKAVVPDLALIDPVTLLSMTPYLTACTGLDAMVHAVEAYVSNGRSPITDLHALEAIRILSASLLASVQEPSNLALRSSVMLASLQAGLAFSNASLGVVHAMAHSLGGFLDLPHGECNALLLPHVLDYNFSASPERFMRIGEALGVEYKGLSEDDTRKRIIDAVLALREQCGVMPGLTARGVRSADISRLAGKAIHDPCNATNPRKPVVRDLEVLYGEAM